MSPDSVASIIEYIASHWKLSPDAEITIEANPTTFDLKRFQAFRDAGINRISIGVQSLRDDALKLLGRNHDSQQAKKAFDCAMNIFGNVSIDLMFGRQFQTQESWQTELGAALRWQPTHLSLYQLTIEPGTTFGRRHKANRLPGLPSEDLLYDMYVDTYRMCEAAEYRCYEISNFAKPGCESKHNLLYWRYQDYLGIGPGAHSRLTINSQRYAIETVNLPVKWLQQIDEAEHGESHRTLLSKSESANEYLMVSLRLDEGMSNNRYAGLCGHELDKSAIDEMVQQGWLECDGDRIHATRKGQLALNTLIHRLLN